MPTKDQFELAAEKFDSAAELLGGLTTAAESADAARILQGGSLGRRVPERIASSAASARDCRGSIEDAAATCRERAAIIAEYEVRLIIYQASYDYYTRAMWNWSAQHTVWFLDETGLVSHPGPQPVPPNKPTPPPDWADVTRP